MRHLRFSVAEGVPEAIAPYSHVTEHAGTLYVTGQMPIDPKTGGLVSGGVAEQTDQVMRNLIRVLTLSGSDLDHVLHARAYLISMADFGVFNQAYQAWFTAGRLPARTCVAVSGLALGARVEIDLLAAPASSSRSDTGYHGG